MVCLQTFASWNTTAELEVPGQYSFQKGKNTLLHYDKLINTPFWLWALLSYHHWIANICTNPEVALGVSLLFIFHNQLDQLIQPQQLDWNNDPLLKRQQWQLIKLAPTDHKTLKICRPLTKKSPAELDLASAYKTVPWQHINRLRTFHKATTSPIGVKASFWCLRATEEWSYTSNLAIAVKTNCSLQHLCLASSRATP